MIRLHPHIQNHHTKLTTILNMTGPLTFSQSTLIRKKALMEVRHEANEPSETEPIYPGHHLPIKMSDQTVCPNTCCAKMLSDHQAKSYFLEISVTAQLQTCSRKVNFLHCCHTDLIESNATMIA